MYYKRRITMKLYIKQRVFTYKDKFDIRNSSNNVEYTVKGKIFALSKRFNISNSKGKKVAVIKKKIFSIFPQYKINIVDDRTYHLKRKFTFFKQKYRVKPLGWELKGDFINRNYEILNNKETIMTFHKHWFKWGDSYELDIPNHNNALLSLCIAIAVDSEIAVDKKIVREK